MLLSHNDEVWGDDAKATSMAWVCSSAASEDVYTARGRVEDTMCESLRLVVWVQKKTK